MAQVQLADELGYDMAWLAELHSARRFSVMPAPLLMASALSQTTERIMLGTAVNLLPLHHPVRIAEEVATLDVLSDGRAVFGIGAAPTPIITGDTVFRRKWNLPREWRAWAS